MVRARSSSPARGARTRRVTAALAWPRIIWTCFTTLTGDQRAGGVVPQVVSLAAGASHRTACCRRARRDLAALTYHGDSRPSTTSPVERRRGDDRSTSWSTVVPPMTGNQSTRSRCQPRRWRSGHTFAAAVVAGGPWWREALPLPSTTPTRRALPQVVSRRPGRTGRNNSRCPGRAERPGAWVSSTSASSTVCSTSFQRQARQRPAAGAAGPVRPAGPPRRRPAAGSPPAARWRSPARRGRCRRLVGGRDVTSPGQAARSGQPLCVRGQGCATSPGPRSARRPSTQRAPGLALPSPPDRQREPLSRAARCSTAHLALRPHRQLSTTRCFGAAPADRTVPAGAR